MRTKQYALLIVLLTALVVTVTACGGGERERDVAIAVALTQTAAAVSVPASATIATATPLPVVASPTPPPPPLGPGRLTGRVCFPSEATPPMTAYFQNVATGQVVELAVQQNQQAYSIDLPPGEYIAYAWLPDWVMGGSYSAAVPCGLGAECTDHTPRAFKVNAGQGIGGIDLCDWYGPPGSVPLPPGAAAPPASGWDTLEGFEAQLADAVTSRNFQPVVSHMSNPFAIAGWQAGGSEWAPQAAIEQLLNYHIAPNATITFGQPQTDLSVLLDGIDPLKMWGPDVNAVDALYSTGWGPAGSGEALLIITQSPDGGFYWHSILIAAQGF